MKILYFTASGNSMHVAKSFGGEILSVPKMIKEGTYEFSDDKIGVVFPVYSWVAPSIVIDFLKKAKFNCNYLFAVYTYGAYDGACTTSLNNIAKHSGYKFNYINKVKMVDNYIIGFDMQKQIKTEHKKEIEKHIKIIKSEINSSKNFIPKDNGLKKFGNKVMSKMEHNSPHEKFSIENKCTKCNVCVKVCPKNNITFEILENKIKINNNCISCFACTHNCPYNAIRFKGEKSKFRFRNKSITLEEIINSNE